MVDRQFPTDERSHSQSLDADTLLQSALDQFHEECRRYNEAIGSYNTHLDNHRDRRGLRNIPFRDPITAHETFDSALNGNRSAIKALLTYLIDQAHLDSQLRRHPRTYPIHVEATEHLQIAREQLISTLEEALHHMNNDNN